MNDFLTDIDLNTLNKEFEPLTFQERMTLLFEKFDPEEILVTTSLGSTSSILLHLLSKAAPEHPVNLINTGYLFEETLTHRRNIEQKLGINIVDVKPSKNKHVFTQENNSWNHNNDLCCFVNKVEPMNRLKKGKKIWISGVLRFQNENRRHLNIFHDSGNIIKFHPIIDMKQEDVGLYHQVFDLPVNSLFYQGYGSIGCHHCTAKGEGREGRWLNAQKTECGLHL
ncbi:MAG: phosphoadenylyl-sulfate reductase [Cytophagales bacterium]|nr:phosphoadenylyl-sulfate reductase [Cytophagales bacterium]